MNRLDFAARTYLGTPFLHQGRNPKAGIDCIGLLMLSAIDCGFTHLTEHDFISYERHPSAQELERRLAAAMGSPVETIRPGDVVSIEFTGQNRKVTRHIGIIGADGERPTLIHTYNSPAKVIEHGLDVRWLRRITGIYRMGAV